MTNNITENKIERILTKFENFDITSGYRMLMLIDRSKCELNSRQKKCIRRISKNKEEFIEMLRYLLNNKKEGERIYSCVNERDINKAIRNFKQNQLDADYYDEESKNSFYLDIKNRWISAMMKPQAKKTSYFLLDIDTKDKESVESIVKYVGEISRNYIKYETKNGYHIICPPFNPQLLQGVDIKKDGMLLLDY